MKDKIIGLIEHAGDAFGSKLQRNVAVGTVTRLFDEEISKRIFIDEVEECDKHIDISEIIYRCDEGFIYKQRERNKNDEWAKNYPYRVALKHEKRGWRVLSTVCDTVESAMILFIGTKNNCEDMVNPTLKLLNIVVKEV